MDELEVKEEDTKEMDELEVVEEDTKEMAKEDTTNEDTTKKRTSEVIDLCSTSDEEEPVRAPPVRAPPPRTLTSFAVTSKPKANEPSVTAKIKRTTINLHSNQIQCLLHNADQQQ